MLVQHVGWWCSRTSLVFLLRICISLTKVRWTCPPQSTLWQSHRTRCASTACDELVAPCCPTSKTPQVLTFPYAKMHVLDSVLWHDEPSGIWAWFGTNLSWEVNRCNTLAPCSLYYGCSLCLAECHGIGGLCHPVNCLAWEGLHPYLPSGWGMNISRGIMEKMSINC